MKFVKRLLQFLFIFLSLCIASIVLLTNYYGDEIKTMVVQNLNKNLRTEVKVSNVEFSVWESFPFASVVFSDLVIYAVDAKNDSLLSAKKLSAKFNLIDLYYENYDLVGLEIESGMCKMQVDNSNNPNYIFWNQSDSSSSNFTIELEKVQISNMHYSYINYSNESNVSFLIHSASIYGNFHESIFDLEMKCKLEKTNIQVGETNFFDNRTLYIAMEGNVDQLKESLNFNEANLGVDDMNIGISGFLNYSEKTLVDFKLLSNNAELNKSIALLPSSIRNKLNRFKIRGKASLNGQISGYLSAESPPAYNFDFSISNGSFKDKNSDLSFENSRLKGSITNGKDRNLKSTALVLEDFETHLKEGKLLGKLKIKDFKSPQYEYNGSVAFKLDEAAQLFKWNQLKNPKGTIKTQLSLKGRLSEVGKYDLNDWKNSTINGTLNLNDLAFSFDNSSQTLSEINGDLSFNNNSLEITTLNGKVNNNSLQLKGKFNNLIAYLLDDKEPLFIDAKLNSPKIDLAALLASQESSSNNEKVYELDVSPRITVYLDTEVDSLEFNQFSLSNLKTIFVVKNERIDARGVSFESQEGKFLGDLFIRENKNNRLNIFSQADLTDVNINKLFKSFNNFGQNGLKAEHLAGVATINLRFNSEWSKQFVIDQKTIRVDADFIIEDGALINFNPLESLSKFIEVEELKEVKFKTLQNQLLIKDESITIPRFDVFSSALNLSVAGTHTFNNEIDYHVTLLLSEVLSRKAKKPKESEFGYVEEDGLKGSKLFLKMTGTIDNPTIKYDSKELRKNIKKKFTQEKKTFKGLLKEEFGLFKKDSSVKIEPEIKSKSSPFEVEIDSSFVKKPDNKKNFSKHTDNQGDESKNNNASENKSKFGKFLDKIAKPNEEEFVEPIED